MTRPVAKTMTMTITTITYDGTPEGLADALEAHDRYLAVHGRPEDPSGPTRALWIALDRTKPNGTILLSRKTR